MTFADLIYKAWSAISAHRTKLAGIVTTALAYAAGQAWMPPQYVAAMTFASGLLTILCGVANTSAIASKLANPTRPS